MFLHSMTIIEQYRAKNKTNTGLNVAKTVDGMRHKHVSSAI